jgi:hypothetical protein
MDVVKIAEIITGLIEVIGKTRREIETKGQAKAKAISDYDRKMAITLAELRNNESYTLGEKTYKTPPVSIMEKIAKGICSQERYELEIAESNYKATVSNLNAMLAQLNGYQSIYKHLSIM